MNDISTTAQIESEDSINKRKILNKIKDEISKIRNYTPRVGIFGDSGVGKSSLCNALFGKDVAEISDVEACTRHPQDIFIGNGATGGIILVDVPGIGEDPQKHQEYINLYKSLTPELDLVIWAIKADVRSLNSAIDAYEKVLKGKEDQCPTVFVITQVDKIEPYMDWDTANNRPCQEQKSNLDAKIIDISKKFGVSANMIEAVSSHPKRLYNLDGLVTKIVEILPNEKKYAFAREAKEENVSEETAKQAEKGILDHIKEKIGDAWEYVKDDVIDYTIETIKEYAPKAIKAAAGWLKSIWK